jgi:DNA-binding phage protein
MSRNKDKLTISHDEVMIEKLRRVPEFAAEYLRAAMEDTDEPRVLLIALRQIAEAGGMADISGVASD